MCPRHSSSDTPCSAIFDHLRTLLIFYLLHNHLTLLHKSPEELCKSFYWFLTFSPLKYPQCLCPPVHPPRLAGWRTCHQVPPRKSPCSSQGPSSRIQTFPEKNPACPCLVRTQQHVLPMSLCSSFLCTLLSVVLLHLTEDIILIYAMLLRSYCIILHYWCFMVCNWEKKGQRDESSAEGLGLFSCLPGLGRQ